MSFLNQAKWEIAVVQMETDILLKLSEKTS